MKEDLVKIVARLYTLMDELEDSNTHQKLELEETIDDLERMILDENPPKDLEVEIEKAKWVCSICGKSSWETGWDYIGSGTNHLGCELEVEMKAGDVMVQRATWHGWANRSDKPCQIAFILIGGKEPANHHHPL